MASKSQDILTIRRILARFHHFRDHSLPIRGLWLTPCQTTIPFATFKKLELLRQKSGLYPYFYSSLSIAHLLPVLLNSSLHPLLAPFIASR